MDILYVYANNVFIITLYILLELRTFVLTNLSKLLHFFWFKLFNGRLFVFLNFAITFTITINKIDD